MTRRLRVLLLLLVTLLGGATATAPAANAVVGGTAAGHLRGQVQFWVNGNYTCTGTLIGGNWVLTARHCITGSGATADNSSVYAGDRRLGEGYRMTIAGIYRHPDQDAALLNLWQNVPNSNLIVSYGLGAPGINSLVSISGWGSQTTIPSGPALELQVCTMRVNQVWFHQPQVGPGNTAISYVYNGAGVPASGDSGAGMYHSSTGRIYAVHTGGDAISAGVGVSTSSIANWIQGVSGIAPYHVG